MVHKVGLLGFYHPMPLNGVVVAFECVFVPRIMSVMCGVFFGVHVFTDCMDVVLVMTFGSSNDVPDYRLP